MSDIYSEMETLESEETLIPGLPPPPTNPATSPTMNPANLTTNPTSTPATNQNTNTANNYQRRSGSAITNNPRRNTPRRCLIHLVVRCPICSQTPHHCNPRFFRQERIRAILALIREVFGVNLNPRELALFIAGYYA